MTRREVALPTELPRPIQSRILGESYLRGLDDLVNLDLDQRVRDLTSSGMPLRKAPGA